MNQDYWPTIDWRAAEPASVGMRGELISELDREIAARYRSIRAFLVVRSGYLVFERYYGGCGAHDKNRVASVTKSFVSALVGIAIDRGFIEGVEQKVLDYFPEYAAGLDDPLKRELTIQHLLTMTAGFQWRTGARAHELLVNRMRRSADWVRFILELPLKARSLGVFQYNSAASHLLSAILTRSTGRCAQELAAEHLFTPLGMDPPASSIPRSFSQDEVFRNQAGWPQDPQGNSIGGWGLVLKPRDMARFGSLYLNHGHWEGEQIFSEKWVVDSITPHTPNYGYHWWLGAVNGVFAYSAVGYGGNYVFCIPEKDLVVVIASRPVRKWRDGGRLLEKFVLPAVVE